MIDASSSTASKHSDDSFVTVKVLRQKAPGQESYWETFRVQRESEMNVISVLQRIAANPVNARGEKVAPVVWDCNCLEEVCGACTMVINGRVRQSCSALVDRLLKDHPEGIELRPMTKFPVVRDLMVDRSRMFNALKRVHAWIDADGYYDAGAGPKMSMEDAEGRYKLSECMTCGCCLEACPQYSKIDVKREEHETDEAYAARQAEAYSHGFLGAAAISQAVLFNRHPTGAMNAAKRLDALMEEGGIQVCGNAQNCAAVCPKHIPLLTSLGRAGRETTLRAFKKFFGS